jgi:hypothetical protein
LRAAPSPAAVPSIIFTPEHNEPEVTALAQTCGINSVLSEPSTPGKILRIVEGVLRISAARLK